MKSITTTCPRCDGSGVCELPSDGRSEPTGETVHCPDGCDHGQVPVMCDGGSYGHPCDNEAAERLDDGYAFCRGCLPLAKASRDMETDAGHTTWLSQSRAS